MDEAEITKKLKKIFKEHLVENEPLSLHTTIGIGGPARYFLTVSYLSDLIKAVITAKELGLSYFILGNGSNILVGDKGFNGLCIKNNCCSISFIKDKAQVLVDSGASLTKLIAESASRDLGGLEFLYGIPGTIGGAVVSNAGTFGGAIGDFLVSATILNPEGEIKRVKRNWFNFGYRDSKLIHLKPRPIVLSVCLQLLRNRKEEILRKLQHYLTIRQKKQPAERSAGSFFKNPKVNKEWAKKYFKMVGGNNQEILEIIEKTAHIPAGWLLDQIRAKKMKVGGARVSKKHANFIVNPKGKAKATDVRELASLLKQRVYEKFGIMLEEEIEYIGEF